MGFSIGFFKCKFHLLDEINIFELRNFFLKSTYFGQKIVKACKKTSFSWENTLLWEFWHLFKWKKTHIFAEYLKDEFLRGKA